MVDLIYFCGWFFLVFIKILIIFVGVVRLNVEFEGCE